MGAYTLQESPASASSDDYVTVVTRLDQTNEPKNLGDVVQECKANSSCKVITNIIEIWTEIHLTVFLVVRPQYCRSQYQVLRIGTS